MDIEIKRIITSWAWDIYAYYSAQVIYTPSNSSIKLLTFK